VPAGAFDVAIIANILHHWDVETIQRLLATVRDALDRDGRLFVAGPAPDDGRTGPASALTIGPWGPRP